MRAECLSNQQLEAFVNNDLDAAQRGAMIAHIGDCENCSALVALVLSTPATKPSPASLRKGDLLGRWAIVERLGSGAMGTVYKAFDPVLDRHVAIKVLHGHLDEVQRRLLREARLLAKLSHANVVQIHEVVADAFLVMELVEGETLEAFFAHRPPRSSVLARCLEAGRGLAAAHAQNVLHGDFKPSNVLVGHDHRVRVADFGLSRSLQEQEGSTRSGTIAYMAPERIRGDAVDARADQFSFCVVLFEGLCGERPYALSSVDDALAAAEAGPEANLARSRLPKALRAVLARGLAPKPEHRFESMEALISALERATRERRWPGLVAGVALAGLAATVTAVAANSNPCSGFEQRLAGVWDQPTRAHIEQVFQNTRAPYARETFEALAEQLDGYTRAWVAEQVEACRATRVRNEQPEHALNLRNSCLSRQMQRLSSLTDVLKKADQTIVDNAVGATRALERPSVCANVAALEGIAHAPTAPSQQAMLRALDERLATAQTQYDLGHVSEAKAILEAIDRDGVAASLNHRPFLARLALLKGAVLGLTAADRTVAKTEFTNAMIWADASRDDRLVARARLELAHNASGEQLAETGLWLRQAAATIERLGGDLALEQEWSTAQSLLLAAQRDTAGAQREGERALALAAQLAGPDSLEVAESLMDLSALLAEVGQFDRAISYASRGVALTEKRLGPVHPRTARAHNSMAYAYLLADRNEEGLAETLAAYKGYAAAVTPNHPRMITTMVGLATAYQKLGKLDEASHWYLEALPLAEQDGPCSTRIVGILGGLGPLVRKRGQLQQAIAYLERALACLDGPANAVSYMLPGLAVNLGNAYFEDNRPTQALALYERAVSSREKAAGPQHPKLASPLVGMSACWLRLKQPTKSIALAERALALQEQAKVADEEIAPTRFVLAQALADSGGDLRRARQLARSAETAFRAAGSGQAKTLAEVVAWRAKWDRGSATAPVR